jgi:hypothetical protein
MDPLPRELAVEGMVLPLGPLSPEETYMEAGISDGKKTV